ncbi:MAG: heme lyase CcmF/NrfE family subunit [Proteobacteria bacterium]|nr:heme lyase CcmF/NrfE family subunit [Pseudomonadota bacterium]
MIPELGLFALVLAFCLAIIQSFAGLAGAYWRKAEWLALVRPMASGQFVFAALSFGLLTWSFIVNDFSVEYVAFNSNTELPLFYRVAAVWAAHEGSLLLWILTLSVWTLGVAWANKDMPDVFRARILGVMGLINCGFMLFVMATSNPFTRLLPAALEGRDLNPLLQDPALAIHPPILYAGYVGLAVAFSFAVAALIEGKVTSNWARWLRPWTLLAWVFLTVGVALGSWWAYYELGWGGWWFWDPVENASFMPWLMATALIHSLAVTEKRGLFKSWTVLLAISGFSLSLLGTFLVRSGVLISVHAFASDPARGLFILIFLGLCIGIALGLYAWRAPTLGSGGGFKVLSRESFLLFNNLMLVVAAGLILIGTLYPLFIDALEMGKISVGPPYFNLVFLIPTLPMVLLLGVGMHSTWKRARWDMLWLRLKMPLLIAATLALGISFAWGRPSVLTFVGVFAGVWVILSALSEIRQRQKMGRNFFALPRSIIGMLVAHIGLGLFVLGTTVTSVFSIEKDLALRPGDSVELAGYQFKLESLRNTEGPNFDAVEGVVTIRRDGEVVTTLYPQKRVYRVQTSPMTEAGIDAGWTRDLFVALGDDLGNGSWSLRIQFKPLVRFIWLGALVMAFGGLLSISDPRYRKKRQAEAPAPELAAGAAP